MTKISIPEYTIILLKLFKDKLIKISQVKLHLKKIKIHQNEGREVLEYQ